VARAQDPIMAVPASTLLLIICYWHARDSGFNQASCIVRHRCHHPIMTSAVGPPAVWRAFQKVKHALYSRRALPLLQTPPLLNAPAASFIHAEKHPQIRAFMLNALDLWLHSQVQGINPQLLGRFTT